MARRGSPQVIFRLPEEKLTKLKAIAGCFEQSLSDVIREGVDMVIAHYFAYAETAEAGDDPEQMSIDEPEK